MAEVEKLSLHYLAKFLNLVICMGRIKRAECLVFLRLYDEEGFCRPCIRRLYRRNDYSKSKRGNPRYAMVRNAWSSCCFMGLSLALFQASHII